MNANMTRQLRTTQRRMLRWMLGGFWQGFQKNRKPEEGLRRGAADGSDDDDNTDDEEEEPTEIEKDDLQEYETWIEWLRQRTRLTEHGLESLRLDDWVQAQRRHKWKYCGHILR